MPTYALVSWVIKLIVCPAYTFLAVGFITDAVEAAAPVGAAAVPVVVTHTVLPVPMENIAIHVP